MLSFMQQGPDLVIINPRMPLKSVCMNPLVPGACKLSCPVLKINSSTGKKKKKKFSQNQTKLTLNVQDYK